MLFFFQQRNFVHFYYLRTIVHLRVFYGVHVAHIWSCLCCVVCLFVCYFYFCSVFVLCLVFPLLSVSLDCLSNCCQCLWIVYPIVVSVSGLSLPLLSVSLDCLSHCCQCLWIVYPIVVSVSELSIHDYALRDYVLYQ